MRFPPSWGLSAYEDRILYVMTMRQCATPDAIYSDLYGDGLTRHGNAPNRATLASLISRLRGKMKKRGVTIASRRGSGFTLDGDARARLKAVLKDVSADEAIRAEASLRVALVRIREIADRVDAVLTGAEALVKSAQAALNDVKKAS